MTRPAPIRARATGCSLLLALLVFAVVLAVWDTSRSVRSSGASPSRPIPGTTDSARIGRSAGEPRGRQGPTPAPVSVTGGERARLRVRIVDEVGRLDAAAWAEAVDCPTLQMSSSTDPDVLAYEVEAGPCDLRAGRADGLATTSGPVVHVEARAGETLDLELSIPSARTGGVQLAFQPTDDGVRVMWVPPGSELEGAGVVTGDRIVAVGGRSLAGLDAGEVTASLTGAEGEEVTLEVVRTGTDTATAVEELILRHRVVEPE